MQLTAVFHLIGIRWSENDRKTWTPSPFWKPTQTDVNGWWKLNCLLLMVQSWFSRDAENFLFFKFWLPKRVKCVGAACAAGGAPPIQSASSFGREACHAAALGSRALFSWQSSQSGQKSQHSFWLLLLSPWLVTFSLAFFFFSFWLTGWTSRRNCCVTVSPDYAETNASRERLSPNPPVKRRTPITWRRTSCSDPTAPNVRILSSRLPPCFSSSSQRGGRCRPADAVNTHIHTCEATHAALAVFSFDLSYFPHPAAAQRWSTTVDFDYIHLLAPMWSAVFLEVLAANKTKTKILKMLRFFQKVLLLWPDPASPRRPNKS